MKKVTKRLFAAFAAVLMIAAIFPMSAFAAQTDASCGCADGKSCTCTDNNCTCGDECICADCGIDSGMSVDPTGQKISEPGIEKEVNDSKSTGAAAGDTVTYTLSSNIPETLFDYLGYDSYVLTFHDTMDDELSFDEWSFVVTIGSVYIPEEYYTIDTTPSDDCTFEVAMDLVALWQSGIITDDDIEYCTEIVISYCATLDTDEPGAYFNYAHVSYPDGESVIDSATVYTYGIRIFKYDENTRYGLEGAEFTLYMSDGCTVVMIGVSDESGYLVIDGLDAGTYYLKETEAPDGYLKSDALITINIPDDVGDDYYVNVEFANTEIPHTGGIGTTIFTVCGAAMITIAGAAFVISRRKKEEA